MSEWSIPDAIEEVVGYRAWRVTSDGLLSATGSSNYGTWGPGQNDARCFADPYDHTRTYRVNGPDGLETVTEDMHGLIPAPECACGFWLLKGLDHVIDKFIAGPEASFTNSYAMLSASLLGGDPPGAFVIGKVKAWGRVVAGEKGWRAERAEIVELYEAEHRLLAPAETVRKIANHYEVPMVRETHLDAPKPPSRSLPRGYEPERYGYRGWSQTGANSYHMHVSAPSASYSFQDDLYESLTKELKEPSPAKWKRFLGILGVTS